MHIHSVVKLNFNPIHVSTRIRVEYLQLVSRMSLLYPCNMLNLVHMYMYNKLVIGLVCEDNN